MKKYWPKPTVIFSRTSCHLVMQERGKQRITHNNSQTWGARFKKHTSKKQEPNPPSFQRGSHVAYCNKTKQKSSDTLKTNSMYSSMSFCESEIMFSYAYQKKISLHTFIRKITKESSTKNCSRGLLGLYFFLLGVDHVWNFQMSFSMDG